MYISKQQKGFIHPSTINSAYQHHEDASDASSFENEFASPGTIDHASFLTIADGNIMKIKYKI